MKIGILTFHCAINYGAVLQAYALQEYLNSIGHNAYIIDYRPNYLLHPYRIFRWEEVPKSHKERIRWFVRELMVIPIRLKRKIGFRKFVNTYLNLHQLDLCKSNNDFDAFVFGSDQIWNEQLTNGYDRYFWGDFPAAKGKKLIAYAASMGDNLPDLGDSEIIKKRLEKFDLIGVREQALLDYLDFSNIKCLKVVDPVFLGGNNVFNELVIPAKQVVNCSYLLMFTLGRDEYVLPIAEHIASLLGLQIIEVISSNESIALKNKRQCLNPLDFLSYLRNASYVVTSSFHGTAFSILFEKDFTVVKPNNAKAHRIESLLEIANLTSRLVCNNARNIDVTSIDYESRRNNLNSINRLSVDFWAKA